MHALSSRGRMNKKGMTTSNLDLSMIPELYVYMNIISAFLLIHKLMDSSKMVVL